MYAIEFVSDNPNPKVGSFRINADIIGSFSKLIVPKDSPVRNYCMIADNLFASDINRVDIVNSDQDKTMISVTRALLAFDDKARNYIEKRLQQILESGLTLVHAQELKRDFSIKAAFNAHGDPVKQAVQLSFYDQVNPALAKDGGAMELIDVVKEQSGKVTAQVALIGSCNGCRDATTKTLKNATAKIQEVFDAAKLREPNNPDVQKLNFSGIEIQNAAHLIFSR